MGAIVAGPLVVVARQLRATSAFQDPNRGLARILYDAPIGLFMKG
jgi:hypothetical protein